MIKPILFKPEMVKAIIEGRKTETRRIIKDSFNGCWHGEGFGTGHPCPNDPIVMHPGDVNVDEEGNQITFSGDCVEAWFFCSTMDKVAKCPFGKIGDELWVKEQYFAYGYWVEARKKSGKIGWRFIDVTDSSDFEYRYSDNPPERIKSISERSMGWYKRNSLFMPISASRIKLRITDILTQRLLDITEESAIAEGIWINDAGDFYDYIRGGFPWRFDPHSSYFSLWDSINGTDSHKINPWVWVVKFEMI